jgi:cyclophilin family peptidyl-prolyl cis-trans isomerase
MRWLASKLRNLLPHRDVPRTGSRAARQPARARPRLEQLEDRSLPAANASGTISGFAFIDANGNGLRDAGETALPGVPVTLTGGTSGNAVNVTVTTDANGAYTIANVLPGTYQLSAGPGQSLLGGSPSFGGTSGPQGTDTVSGIVVSGGQVVNQDFGFQGLSADSISLREFLTTTTDSDLPFAAAGSGQGQAGSRPNSAPFVKTPIGNVTVPVNTADKMIDLAAFFSDPDITDSTIVFNTSAGPINVELFDTKTPQTVANFFDYINSGAFTNSIFHRLVNNFVLQGGGFTFDAKTASLPAITTLPAVQNEFGTSNTIGTIAMAKLGSDPNSATSQFFFNLADNSSNLDKQNGGFTVFGKIVSPADQNVINTLTAATITDQSNGDPNSPFTSIPLNNYTGHNFPKDTTAANYDLVQSVTIASQNEALTYKVVSNSNPAVVTASISNERLTLHYPPNQTGTSTITVQAIDKFGATVNATFTVTVTP